MKSALALALTVAAWLAFAPARFGGSVEYVLISGNSMEPNLYRGDVVVLRHTHDYDVGDVVTYLQPDIGPVIHRIVACEGARYVLKGDNNPWLDRYEPLEEDIIGEMWLHIPNAGRVVALLRSPLGAALLASILGGIAIMSMMTGRTGQSQPTQNQQAGDCLADGFLVLLALLGASIALAVAAFAQPEVHTVPQEIPYEQRGTFEYGASVPPGVYETTALQTGDPVFRELAEDLVVQFNYQFNAEEDAHISGAYRLVAEVSETSGWTRTIELQPATLFEGSSASMVGQVNLHEIQGMIDNLELWTGIERKEYTLSVVPEVQVEGTLAGQPFQDDFSPRMTFVLTETQLWLADKDERGQEVISRSEASTVMLLREEPNSMTLLGFALDVGTARYAAMGGILLSGNGLVILGIAAILRARKRRNEDAWRVMAPATVREVVRPRPEPVACADAVVTGTELVPQAICVQPEPASPSPAFPPHGPDGARAPVAYDLDESESEPEDVWVPPPPYTVRSAPSSGNGESTGFPLGSAWQRALVTNHTQKSHRPS